MAGGDEVCAAALEVFCRSYAAAAGDAALCQLALGGVWLGGGIAPRILPALRRPDFTRAFCDKGRFQALLSSLRLEVCLEPDTALHGAARLALRDAREPI
jgi:glucokinase